MPESHAVVITCEHASCHVPRTAAHFVQPYRSLLCTHRGFDIGAAELARALAGTIRAPWFPGRVTRLLVDLNRSVGNRSVFGMAAKSLPTPERQRLLAQFYQPFRQRVRECLRSLAGRRRQILHLSVHTFSPTRNGRTRHCDVGLLYDPRREPEKRFCDAWRQAMRSAMPSLHVRFNYPYRGTSDGHVTALRREFTASRYLGVEIEVNQKFWRRSEDGRAGIFRALSISLKAAFAVC